MGKGRACWLFAEKGGSVRFFIDFGYLDNVEGFSCWGKETLEESLWRYNRSVSWVQSASKSSSVEEGGLVQCFERSWGGSGCCMAEILRVPSADCGIRISGLRSNVGESKRIFIYTFCYCWLTRSFSSGSWRGCLGKFRSIGFGSWRLRDFVPHFFPTIFVLFPYKI